MSTKTIESVGLYDKSDENSYKFLAIAIIHQAMIDYVELKKVPKESRLYEASLIEIQRIKDFFMSEWFKMLNPTGAGGEEVIAMLDNGYEI